VEKRKLQGNPMEMSDNPKIRKITKSLFRQQVSFGRNQEKPARRCGGQGIATFY